MTNPEEYDLVDPGQRRAGQVPGLDAGRGGPAGRRRRAEVRRRVVPEHRLPAEQERHPLRQGRVLLPARARSSASRPVAGPWTWPPSATASGRWSRVSSRCTSASTGRAGPNSSSGTAGSSGLGPMKVSLREGGTRVSAGRERRRQHRYAGGHRRHARPPRGRAPDPRRSPRPGPAARAPGRPRRRLRRAGVGPGLPPVREPGDGRGAEPRPRPPRGPGRVRRRWRELFADEGI